MPHAHILLWLDGGIPPNNIDSCISAEIPNPEDDPRLHEIVKRHMVHGPCGVINSLSPCMADGKCQKKFPKPFIDETQTGDDGYPAYRRRSPSNGGYQTTVGSGRRSFQIDNRWIVPYSPLLLKCFDAHINVEYCHSVKAIKYVCKYINKGCDQAAFTLLNKNDEIAQYEIGRYISSNEAFWRIFGFSIHERYPAVYQLAVHLENGQRVYFTDTNVQNAVNHPQDTTLTAFFKLCSQDDFAKGLLYAEVPEFYTWDASKKEFKRRKTGPMKRNRYTLFLSKLIFCFFISCVY